MDRMHLNKSRWAAPLFAAFSISAAVLVAACGGGGSDGGGSSQGTAQRWAMGPVEGFGSVIVGGIRYDDSNAVVEDEDGTSSTRGGAGLKLGMMVQVSADAPASGASSAQARHIRFGDEVLGPVQAIDAATTTLTVLGQKVVVTATTVFDSAISGGFAGLKTGDVIEVHGILDSANGRIIATRIEPKAGATTYRLRGVVKSLDATAKTFKIGSETISYASLATVPAGLADDRIVRVRLNTTQVSGAWVATRLSLGERKPDDQNEAEVEIHGVISAFTSITAFEVDGNKVDASKARMPADTSGIKLGARVEVEGARVDGVLVATKVELRDEDDHSGSGSGSGGGSLPRGVELHGAVSDLKTADKTFTLRGLTVSYAGAASAPVRFRDGTEADLANGKLVEVKGALSADRTKLNATDIEFE